jgi:hypothetical protein
VAGLSDSCGSGAEAGNPRAIPFGGSCPPGGHIGTQSDSGRLRSRPAVSTRLLCKPLRANSVDSVCGFGRIAPARRGSRDCYVRYAHQVSRRYPIPLPSAPRSTESAALKAAGPGAAALGAEVDKGRLLRASQREDDPRLSGLGHGAQMGAKERQVDIGSRRGRSIVLELGKSCTWLD